MSKSELRFSETHEWIRLEDGRARIGITDYAQGELGDIVYVELPKVGTEVGPGRAFGVVESVKAVSDLYCPVSGTVIEVNESLSGQPETVNQSPYENGWLILVEMTDPSEFNALMDAEQYARVVEEHEGG